MTGEKKKEFSTLRDIYEKAKMEILEECSLCGECIDTCPVYPLIPESEEGPSDIQQKILDALSGEPSDIASEMAYGCSGCGKCNDSCPLDLNPHYLRDILKEDLIRAGFRLPPKKPCIGDKPYDIQELLGFLQVKASHIRWLPEMPKQPVQSDIVLFLGCSVRYQPDKGSALLELLDMAGINYVAIGGGDLCCGGMYLRGGNITQGNLAAGKLIESFDAFRPKKVIFSCSSCYQRIAEIVALLDERRFEIQHVSALLVENLHRFKFKDRIEKSVAIHDPCDLRRKPGDAESVRRLIGSIPGITIEEMKHNRADSLCCGIGSHDKLLHVSKELRKQVLEEAQETGAHILATVCTGCHNHFCRVQKDYPFEIMHYVTLLATAVGVPCEDKIKKYLQFETIDAILADAAEYIEASPYSEEEFRQILPLFFNTHRS